MDLSWLLIMGLCSAVSAEINLLKKFKRQTTPVVCSQPLYTGVVSETATPGTFVLRVSAQDVNGVPLTFSIPDTTLQKFSVNPTTGDITVSSQLSRTFSRSALEIRVRASETSNAANFCESTVRINVLPVTGSSTGTGTTGSFGQSSYTFTVSNCFSGATVGQVFATSTTGGINTYSISGGSSFYTINPTTGVISLITPISGTQTFTVTSTSSTGITSTVPVTVTSNCGSTGIGQFGFPTFSQSSYYFSATSCFPGVSLGQVFASASGATVTYQIVGGTGFFSINPTTGQITTLSTPPSGTQSLTVQAFSSNGQTATVPVLISANCFGTGIGTGITGIVPTFFQSSYSLTATSCTSGSSIGSITATSTFGSVIYSIDGGSPYYAINPSTGAITVTNAPPVGTQTLSIRAQAGGYTSAVPLTITSSCSGTGSGTGVFFQQASYTFTLSTCSIGSQVGQVFATTSSGAITSYTISGGNGQYIVNPSTGAITVISPSSGTSTFSIIATSSNGQTSTVPVTVTSSCSGTGTGSATFSQSSYFFTASSCNQGVTVGQVFATSSGGSVFYTLSGGNGAFTINPTTGQITATGVQVSGTGTLTITAQSSNGGSGTAQVTINAACTGGGITGGGNTIIRGGPPVFTQSAYSCSVSCNPTETQRACVISASNAAQDSMNYILTPSNQFYVDPNSGEIRTAFPLRTAGTYSLTATASDPYGAIATASVTVTQTNSC